MEEGANLIIHDPKVDPRQIKIDLEVNPTEDKKKSKDFEKIQMVDGDFLKIFMKVLKTLTHV